ncbi:MAG: MATE family efflux transporter [Bacteroidales bacterium]|nr:MATE family efflux transporter [Bacteroidales bacterium]
MNRRILKLAIPSIFANITVPLVGMVDIAISGRLGDVAAIGAIAVGSMLFDLLYWNFGFLRVGTGGLTAQAIGRRSLRDAMKYFTQGISTALVSALFLIAIQWLFVEAAFTFIDCTPDVEQLSRKYFFIRIWGAPATLSLFVFKGWFIGMQNTVSPMAVDIFVNVINLVVSFVLGLHTPMGFVGIAWGTVIAQYSGLILAVVLMLIYYRKLFKYVNIRDDIRFKYMKAFYVLNVNLFFRSLCFMLIYCGFTSIAAKYGDTELAVSSIIMKLLMLYSYFLDGFAYAGEALAGKYIGANDRAALGKAVKYLFGWTALLVVISTAAYWVGGEWMISLMTTQQSVIDASSPYIIWLILMPLFSCAAFMWDGIYIGATASVAIRNCMIWACVAFYITYFALKASMGMQALYCAYFAHIIVRAAYMTLFARREVFSKVS